ncbi:MAG: hypothetical protein IJ356_10820 [Erysipelotrichaceae bacterium]|nr:hypothetical protein [Erysipelotrichaceae bacterium]
MAETKIVVLDDDPTGIQTVHDIDVLMKFDENELIKMMQDPSGLVYLSTNSRSLMPEETKQLHRQIISNLVKASEVTRRDFLVISRGDSTLRGHYPLESEVIKEELMKSKKSLKGEVLCPYLDGIRKTECDIHYVLSNQTWIPCAETEFAKDATFSYCSSDLKDYVCEKYGKQMPCVSIGLDLLDGTHQKEILRTLEEAIDGSKVIVNATSMEHLKAFTEALKPVQNQYQYRTAASFVKALACVADQPYIEMKDLCDDSNAGGLILAGSHVQKTTEQIECLMQTNLVEVFVLDVSKEIESQLNELAHKTDALLKQGKNVLIMTSRQRIVFDGDAFEQLSASRRISEQFVSILHRLKVRPSFLISKGGITSFDVLKKGLNVSSARVLGQVSINIPVVQLREESRFPGMNVIIFPGNVGKTETLKELIEKI